MYELGCLWLPVRWSFVHVFPLRLPLLCFPRALPGRPFSLTCRVPVERRVSPHFRHSAHSVSWSPAAIQRDWSIWGGMPVDSCPPFIDWLLGTRTFLSFMC